MSKHSPETIYPCPFSKGYGIPVQQAWHLLKVYLSYRFTLSCILLLLFYTASVNSIIGSHNSTLFIFCSQSYMFLTIISVIGIIWRFVSYTTQAQILIFTDIIILTLLMHACGGIDSGLGMLLAVSIAAGGLLIGGRCAMLFAALASLAVLSEHIFSMQTNVFKNSSYTYAGLLGASYFAIALLSYILAQRAEQLNQQKNWAIFKLEELNQYIIQHLQSGIIVTDQSQKIQLANETALRLANLPFIPQTLSDISQYLSLSLNSWIQNANQDLAPLQLPGQDEVHLRFMQLPTQNEPSYMIILEDIALYNQRLQQSKLASLGQLTASIAHEIRNPLGAISHAGQLLNESSNLSSQDRRLIEIIRNHSHRVNRIIEDMLQLSKRSASVRERVDLSLWLEQYITQLIQEHDLDKQTFNLTVQKANLTVFIDPGHLKQIMDNLSLNAVKYGQPEKGPLQINAYLDKNNICIDIIDNGTGLSDKHLKHLFEPFFTTSATGTGLGLYISKELAELNQANLSYHLSNQKHCCFRLCLVNADHLIIEI